MKHNEKPDILNRIRYIKLRKELTVLLAFFVMLSTSYVMIHPSEALNNSSARTFMFFNEEEGMEETAVPDMNALLDADRDAETAEEEPAEVTVTEETEYAEPVETPAETVVPTLEPTVPAEETEEPEGTPVSTAVATAEPEESEETSDPLSTASAEPVLEETSVPEATASAEPEATASAEPTETPEVTASPEPSATPEAEEEQYPAIDFGEITPLEEDGTETLENLKVVIKAPEGAFPEGTTVKVVLVRDTKVLEAIEQAAVEAAEEMVEVKEVKAVDITFFDKDGEEVQPEKAIAVSFKSELVKEAENTTVVHVEQDENKEEVINTTTVETVTNPEDSELVDSIEENEAVILTDSFSVYGIVGTELITEVTLPGSDDTYEVSVTYGADAKIPENVHLEVASLSEDNTEFQKAKEALIAAKLAEDEEFDESTLGFAALDISIVDDETGEKIEPAEGAEVKVSFKMNVLPEDVNEDDLAETLEIQHLNESTGIAEDETVAQSQDVTVADGSAEAEFTITSFSTFTITWGGGTAYTSTNLRLRNGNNTRGQVTFNYVDSNGDAINRPTGIENDTDITINTNWPTNYEVVISSSNVARNISGRTYQRAYITVNGVEWQVTRLLFTRSGNNDWRIDYYNGDTRVTYVTGQNVGGNWRIPVYLQYTSLPDDGNSSTIHYGYMDGNTFVEFSQDDLPPTPVEITSSGSSHFAYLVYDFDGYHYADETYYHPSATTTPRADGTQTQPLLRWSGSGNKWTYTSSGDLHTYHNSNNQSDVAIGSHIYVIYEQDSAIPQGGTPKLRPVNPDEVPEPPTLTKNSLNNDDGTNTISLGITGSTTEMEVEKLADVIVVFDVSTSMNLNLDGSGNYGSGSYDINGNNRIANAGRAAESLAASLLEKKNSDGDPLVRMALVPFSMTASIHSFNDGNFTTDIREFNSAVEGLQLSSGTNWEDALMKANQLSVDPDRATFVIFITDGEPSMRVSRGSYTDAQIASENGNAAQYLARTTFYGGLSSDNTKNYDLAVPAATAIVGANKNLYTIGISSDVSTLTQLTEDCGAGADHSKTATDEDELVQAFNDIEASIISLLGAGDVHITDGITSLTNLKAKVLETVDPNSFKYYRYGGWKTTTVGGEEVKTKDKYGADYEHKTEWTTREADGCAVAAYDEASKSVQWNMGRNFQLEEDVTYVVEFRVWPSQGAYDLVADLNNGVKEHRVKTNESDSKGITQEEYDQIVELSAPVFDAEGHCTTPGNYTLKTNTDDGVGATYTLCTKTGAAVTYADGAQEKPVNYMEGILQNMDLTSELLKIIKIFDQSLDPRTVGSVTLQLQRMVNDDEHVMADYNVPGTDSPLIQLSDENEWMCSFYVAPGFIVEGETLEFGYKFTVTEPEQYLGDNTVRYDLIPEIVNPMVVNGSLQLIGDGDGNQALTAINRTRSAVEIHKTLYDVDGTTEIYPDTEFTITGRLLDPDGNAYTNQETGDPAAYYLYDRDGNATTERLHFADSGNISFKLKAGEFIRFVNVPEGCTFEFQESSIPDNYELDRLAAAGRQRNPETDPAYTYSIILSDTDAHLVEGETTISTTEEGIKGNTNYKLDFYNKRIIPLPDVELVKIDQDDNTKILNGASFELHKDSADGPLVTTDGNGNAISITTGNKEGSTGPDGWYHIGLLPEGTYYMVETNPPIGYVHDETPIIITVTKVDDSYSVTAVKGGTSVITGPVDGLYTITVSNEKSTKYIRVFKYETGTTIPLEGAEFSLTGPEGTNISYSEKTTNAEGYLEFDTDGTTIIKLPAANDTYILNETEAPAGYNKIAENINFTVNTNGVSAVGSGYEVVEESATLDGKEIIVYTIKVANSAGVELPHTGGPGTLLYTLSGIALMLGAALMYGFRMRSRERRLN